MTAMAAPNTTISFATEADISALGEITTAAHSLETVMVFLFKNWPASTTIIPFQTQQVRQKFADRKTRIIKITDSVSFLGFTAITLETGEQVIERGIAGQDATPPEGINWEFASEVVVGLKKLDLLMVGVKHYMVSMLAIHPQHQGKGLGTKIMKFCSKIVDKDGLPIYLTAFPGAHDMYLKLAYKDVAQFEMELNEYGKKYRGFGIYRSYAMLRHPEP